MTLNEIVISAFIDDDGEFDASIDYADNNSNTQNQQDEPYNNNTYPRDGEDDSGDEDLEGEDEEDMSDGEFEMEKDKKPQVSNSSSKTTVDFIKDEEGKFLIHHK